MYISIEELPVYKSYHIPHFLFNYAYAATNGNDEKWNYFTQKVSEILGQSFIYKTEENLLYTKKPIGKKVGLNLWWYCQGLWEGGYFGNTPE